MLASFCKFHAVSTCSIDKQDLLKDSGYSSKFAQIRTPDLVGLFRNRAIGRKRPDLYRRFFCGIDTIPHRASMRDGEPAFISWLYSVYAADEALLQKNGYPK
jgi:hypothetical protein